MDSTALSREIYKAIQERTQAARIANKLALMELSYHPHDDIFTIQISFMILLGYEANQNDPYWSWKKNNLLEEIGRPFISFYLKKLEKWEYENS